MDSKRGSKANLEKYTKVDGKWLFVPVPKQNGVPYPSTVMIGGNHRAPPPAPSTLTATRSSAGVQKPVGNSPCQAKDAWKRHCKSDSGSAHSRRTRKHGSELDAHRDGIRTFLEETSATKEPATDRAYLGNLELCGIKAGSPIRVEGHAARLAREWKKAARRASIRRRLTGR
jgi:hypothetical protein